MIKLILFLSDISSVYYYNSIRFNNRPFYINLFLVSSQLLDSPGTNLYLIK